MSISGLYRSERNGHIFGGAGGQWRECDFSAGSGSLGEDNELLTSPFLGSGFTGYDVASHNGRKLVPQRVIDQFLYPKFDIDGPEDRSTMFDEWVIASLRPTNTSIYSIVDSLRSSMRL